jgi:hypothetical protein
MSEMVMTKERFSELILDYMDNRIESVLEQINEDIEDGLGCLVVDYIEEVIAESAEIKQQRTWTNARNNDWQRMLEAHGIEKEF